MVAKTMTQQEFCRECKQRHECGKVYQQLGKAEGPSVVIKVIAAFLLPVVVFIACLAAFESLLTNSINTKGPRTLIGFLLALSVTFVCILIIKAINRRLSKKK